jgi:cytoskeletal protein RodZ
MEKDQAENLRIKAADLSEIQTRSEVHGKKKEVKKKKENNQKQRKISMFWLTRLLLFTFILLIGLTVTYQYWSQKISTPVHSEDKKGVEQVEIER